MTLAPNKLNNSLKALIENALSDTPKQNFIELDKHTGFMELQELGIKNPKLVRFSYLKHFLKSPLAYINALTAGEIEWSDEMKLGGCFEDYLLNGKLRDRYVVIQDFEKPVPASNMAKTENKQAFSDYTSIVDGVQRMGKIAVPQAVATKAKTLADTARKSRIWKGVQITESHNRFTNECADTGLAITGEVDFKTADSFNDVKLCYDIGEFRRRIEYNYSYWLQCALYCKYDARGEPPKEFNFYVMQTVGLPIFAKFTVNQERILEYVARLDKTLNSLLGCLENGFFEVSV